MRPLSCVACGLPVLDPPGQTVMLQPYVAVDGVPPVGTAGAWHLSCLAADPVAEQWGRAHVHSFVEVRRFDLVARTPQWTVVDNQRTGARWPSCSASATALPDPSRCRRAASGPNGDRRGVDADSGRGDAGRRRGTPA